MMTWPLFSPPTPAPETSIASRMYLSPTGVRTTRPPARSTTAARPPLDSTLTTSVDSASAAAGQPVERDDAQQLVAIHDLAPLVDRHAAVGVAIEGEAHVRALLRRRVAASAAGAVAPQSRLMLLPSGASKWTLTSAPGAAEDLGRQPRRPEPLAQSSDHPQVGRDARCASASPMLPVAVERRRVPSDLAAEAGVGRAGQLVGAPHAAPRARPRLRRRASGPGRRAP